MFGQQIVYMMPVDICNMRDLPLYMMPVSDILTLGTDICIYDASVRYFTSMLDSELQIIWCRLIQPSFLTTCPNQRSRLYRMMPVVYCWYLVWTEESLYYMMAGSTAYFNMGTANCIHRCRLTIANNGDWIVYWCRLISFATWGLNCIYWCWSRYCNMQGLKSVLYMTTNAYDIVIMGTAIVYMMPVDILTVDNMRKLYATDAGNDSLLNWDGALNWWIYVFTAELIF